MLAQRLKKLILLRLLFGTFLLYAPEILYEGSPLIFYESLVALCLLSLIYLIWYTTKRRLQRLALFQIVNDAFLISFLVYFAGGAESIFVLLYPLSILSSALILGSKEIVFRVTTLSCVCYVTSALSSFWYGPSTLMPSDPLYLAYSVAVRVVLFFIVGRLSNYLAQTIMELQNKLRLSERLSLLGEVVSEVSHEIRNPLTAIRTAAEVLKDALLGKLNSQEEKMVNIVYNESDRLTKTLERILSYARQAQPNPKGLLLDSVIERALSLVRLRPELHPEQIVVEKKYEPYPIGIYADEEQIVGLFLNLMLNAYQAMPQGGKFRIVATEDSKGTKIDLEDSGGGIPKEKLNDLFTPFRTTKKGGTGLGLAEVHKIVTLHEGKIEVESLPGRTTIFHLFFPKP